MSDDNPFSALLELADKFCGPIGVDQDLILSLFKEKSDWAFIIQIDALNEAACKDIIARKLTLDGLNAVGFEEMGSFVSKLNFQGRTSILELLRMAGVPREHIDFIDVVRNIRNVFAHDIKSVSRNLIDVVRGRKDKSKVLKILSYIDQFDEKEMTQMFVDDPGLLRFVILQQCLTVLYLLHINLRDREEGAVLAGEA